MPLTAESAVQQIQERLKSIQGLIHQIDDERRRSETNINSILRAQTNMQTQKLKSQYKTSLQDAEQEETTIRAALEKIQEIRNIRNEHRIQSRNAGNKETIQRRGALLNMVQISAQTLPLFVSKPHEKVPPLCGAIPAESNYVAKPGDNVAALVKGLKEGENWILAEVVQFLHRQNKYDVIDIDEQKNRHVLSKSKIIPLPLMRANPETDGHALFPKDTMVMALYPRSTCFYKAIVHRLPQTATDDYELLFEDSDYTNGYAEPLPVAQRYVIAYKPTKKGGSVSST